MKHRVKPLLCFLLAALLLTTALPGIAEEMIPKGPTVLLILDDYGVVDETEHTGRHAGDDGSPDEGMSLCDGQSTAVWDCAVPGFMVCSRVCFKMHGDAISSGFACISRRFSAGLVGSSARKTLQWRVFSGSSAWKSVQWTAWTLR